MSNSATALRRWVGAFSLAVAFAMLIWGQTLLKPYLQGRVFLAYWFLFLAFTCTSVGISLLDFFAVRRVLKDEIADLKARALQGIEATDAGKRRCRLFSRRLERRPATPPSEPPRQPRG